MGPELAHSLERGTYRAVWIALDKLEPERVLPAAVALLVKDNRGEWRDEVLEIDERA